MLECVVNISEGANRAVVGSIADAAGPALLDVHSDAHHHRSVITLVGEDAPRAVTTAALERLDLRGHAGVHPRLGTVDVVPFVALEGSTPDDALAARDRFAVWLADAHGIPCFLYGPERTLPDVRRGAFRTLVPDVGPPTSHPRWGATAVGQRSVLVAYNVWVRDLDLEGARAVAAAVRAPEVRALGLRVGDRVQVSLNLIVPDVVGPASAYDRVAEVAATLGGRADGAELVGLVPETVLAAIPPARWSQLDLSAERTIEARLAAAGIT